MQNSLPSVESASSALQQEEAQRELLHLNKDNVDVSAMFSKTQTDKVTTCTTCGLKGHRGDKCWTIVGYPKWHPKHNPQTHNYNTSSPRPKQYSQNSNSRWNSSNKNPKIAAKDQTSPARDPEYQMFSPQQLE